MRPVFSQCTRTHTGLLLSAAVLLTACPRDVSDPNGNGGEPPDGKPLTIVTWNVHNFVNDVEDSDVLDEKVDAQWSAHKKSVGRVLRSIDADIIVFQEVEHVAALQELNEEEMDSAYPYLSLVDANDPRGIDVGAMSKLPITKTVSHQDDSFTKVGTQGPSYKYARDCAEYHFDFNGRALVLLGIHYKAKENDDPDKRLAEAQHTRAIADALTAENPELATLILGDFNDTPGSVPYDWVIGDEPLQYHNAADHVAAPDRWTFDYQGKLELVDQQMANPVLYPMLDTSSVTILHSEEIDEASDHAPIVATYEVY